MAKGVCVCVRVVHMISPLLQRETFFISSPEPKALGVLIV